MFGAGPRIADSHLSRKWRVSNQAEQPQEPAVAEPESHKAALIPFCRYCGSQHTSQDPCPGELLATGAERHGWRVAVEGGKLGVQVLGTLVAPVGTIWRARIITYPRVLWMIPGGGGSMKFLGSTAVEAEKTAIDYITLHCQLRGHKMNVAVPAVRSESVDLEQDAKTAGSKKVRASQRQLRAITIRFGIGALTSTAETGDLSETGVFIRTETPLPVGAELQMYIELSRFGVPLRGIVQWSRDKHTPGRSVGMGVKLFQPHPRYLHYIRQQRGIEQTSLDPVDPSRTG